MRGLLWLAVLVFPAMAQGQMYKCVDKNGVTHYADAPLPAQLRQALRTCP
jgi:hypothetical protein